MILIKELYHKLCVNSLTILPVGKSAYLLVQIQVSSLNSLPFLHE